MLEGDMEQGLKGEVGDKGSGVDSQYRMAVAGTIGGQSKAWLKYSKYFELEWGKSCHTSLICVPACLHL